MIPAMRAASPLPAQVLIVFLCLAAIGAGVGVGVGAGVEAEAGAEANSGAESQELLRHADFTNSAGDPFASAWKIWQPEWSPAGLQLQATSAGLRCAAAQNPFAVGGVGQVVTGVQPGRAYTVAAECEFFRVSQPQASALVRVEWLKDEVALHPAGELVRGPQVAGHTGHFLDTFVAPTNANGARISLEAKWLRGGSVLWKRASLRLGAPPAPRKVKVGTVYLRPRNSTPKLNLELWCDQVDAAGKLGLDVVCLSEAILMVGTSAQVADVAEPIPGPATLRLGEAARRNRLWIVAGLMEKEGDHLFNTAVLLNRDGQLAGKYRKVHLPREEWRKGIEPGREYPVFRTDFGTVAVQVCYDYFFPETAAAFAQQGAEILFAPTWGTTFQDEDGRAEGRTLFRVRARDNGLYLVPSVYDGESMVIDPLGRVLAANDGKTGVFWAEIDLTRREPLWWVGHWGSIRPRDRMPDTYGTLVASPPAP